jgi:hypothetical protein
MMLRLVGIDIKKETPDGVIEEIFTAIKTTQRLGPCEQDSAQGSNRVDRSGDTIK